MSSILKALRRLEEEKAALGEGGVDISRDILKRSRRMPPNNFFWPLLSAVLFLLLICSGVLLWSNRLTSVVSPGSAPASATAFVAPILEPAVKQTLPVKSAAIVAEIPRPIATPSKITSTEKTRSQRSETIITEAAASWADGAPFLRLSGIAYREKSAERIAIINDLPVMQGTAIEGAQIIEILPDRVVLSWQGRLFDLQIEDDI